MGYSHEELSEIWWASTKPALAPYADHYKFGIDACGALIEWAAYGKADSDNPGNTAWEVAHKIAIAEGGTDNKNNLIALQWTNNRRQGTRPLRVFLEAVSEHMTWKRK